MRRRTVAKFQGNFTIIIWESVVTEHNRHNRESFRKPNYGYNSTTGRRPLVLWVTHVTAFDRIHCYSVHRLVVGRFIHNNDKRENIISILLCFRLQNFDDNKPRKITLFPRMSPERDKCCIHIQHKTIHW